MAKAKKAEPDDEQARESEGSAEAPEESPAAESSEGAAAATSDGPADESADEEGPGWLSQLNQKLDEIHEMVKPKDSPMGAPVIVQGASKVKPTQHEMRTVVAPPAERKPSLTPGSRRLTFFRFRKT